MTAPDTAGKFGAREINTTASASWEPLNMKQVLLGTATGGMSLGVYFCAWNARSMYFVTFKIEEPLFPFSNL
jgi:hypothetical protein